MGFIDHEIKRAFNLCPQATIAIINSVFGRNYPPDTEILYPDKEQTEAGVSSTYMDMLLQILDAR